MEREVLTRNIGKSIRKYRLLHDLSQEALALSAGIHPAYISRLECGEKCPTIDTLYKICDALNISVSELLTFEDAAQSDSEAAHRIEKALEKLPGSKRIKVAEIVETMVNTIIE